MIFFAFNTTYHCNFLFSGMKFVKSKHHATIANELLGESIRTPLIINFLDF